MHAALHCPEHEMLRAFADGRLAETDAEGVATHLSDCPACSAVCDGLFAPFYAGFRATITVATPEPDADLLDQVLPRIKGLARLPGQAATVTPDQSGPETGPSPAADAAHTLAELIAHLPPPRDPGDLARIGPYRLRSVLGQGGMGAVFAAEDAELRRMVAVKIILDPSGGGGTARQRARFLKEARAIAALDHDHIVPVYHAGEDAGVVYLVMPLLRGESLHARLRRDSRLPTGLLGGLGGQIADGLAAAHAAGIIHRDLKPSNVWLEERAGGVRVRLLDFGLAKSLNRDDEFTASHGPMGTPGYMAPEQINGVTATPRTDLFSLGVVLYEMATGTKPFTGNSLREVWDKTCESEPPTPTDVNPSVPGRLSEVIRGLLRKDAVAREPGTAGEAAAALRQIGSDSEGLLAAAVEMAAPPRRRFRLWVTAGVAAALAVAAAAQVVIRIRRDGDAAETEMTVPAGTKVSVGSDGVVGVVLPREGVPPIPNAAALLNLDHYQQTDIGTAQLGALFGAPTAASPELVALVGSLKTNKPEIGKGHRGIVKPPSVHPRGRWLVTTGEESTARVWDLAASEPTEVAILRHADIATVMDAGKDFNSTAFSPDGDRLAIGHASGEVTLHTTQNILVPDRMKKVHARWKTGEEVHTVAFSPDGTRLATGHRGRTAQVFDVADRKASSPPRTIDLGRDGNIGVRFFDGGNRLAVGGRNIFRVVDLQSDKDIVSQYENKVSFLTIAASPDGRYLATNGGHAPTRIEGGMIPIFSQILVKGDPNLVSVRDARNKFAIRRLLAHDGQVVGAEFSPNGQLLATVTADSCRLRVWRWDNETVAFECPVPLPPWTKRDRLGWGVTGLVFHPDGRHVIVSTVDWYAAVFRLPPTAR